MTNHHIFSPEFIHYDKFFLAMKELFKYFQADTKTQAFISSSMLVKNGVILLNGSYGTGKTQIANLIKKVLFSDGNGGYDFDLKTCHQDLTAFDVLYHLDLAELHKGVEKVHPKKMVSARLKFINEIQRANPALYNALLPLLSERVVSYRDEIFRSPDFIMILDQNPQDEASSEIPRAFFDRIDFMTNLAGIDLKKSEKLFNIRIKEYGIEWNGIENMCNEILTSSQMSEIWNDVIKVNINKKELLLANFLINSFSICKKVDRSIIEKSFFLNCESCKFKGEICYSITQIPGQRSLNSLLKLAQARAWLAKKGEISFKDLLFSLPFSLAHRLKLKREELSLYENVFQWIEQKAVKEILKDKFPSWEKAIKIYEEGDVVELNEIASENLVVAGLLN